jgi:hypothetical protein
MLNNSRPAPWPLGKRRRRASPPQPEIRKGAPRLGRACRISCSADRPSVSGICRRTARRRGSPHRNRRSSGLPRPGSRGVTDLSRLALGLPVRLFDLVTQVLDHLPCDGAAQFGVSLFEPAQRQEPERVAGVAPDDGDGLAAVFAECEDEGGHAQPKSFSAARHRRGVVGQSRSGFGPGFGSLATMFRTRSNSASIRSEVTPISASARRRSASASSRFLTRPSG